MFLEMRQRLPRPAFQFGIVKMCARPDREGSVLCHLRCASYGPRQIAGNLGEPPASASCTDVGLLRLSPENILAYLPERRKSHLQMGPGS
jgi:hypothetical protein